MSKLLHKAVRDKNQSAYAVYQEHLSSRPVNVHPLSPIGIFCVFPSLESLLDFLERFQESTENSVWLQRVFLVGDVCITFECLSCP